MSLHKVFSLSIAAACVLCAQARQWGDWQQWGEQPDTTYLNPVIPSDYSDLDCIRVGDEYYAISSTFQFSPGMTVLRSFDLVNWEIVGNAVPDLTQISPALNYDVMNRYARGIWAGMLRNHNGKFYIFFGTPDEGFFMTSAEKPEGPWAPLTCLLAQPGWDDCTVFWDDRKGKAWFVGTQFSDGYTSYICPMDCDGTKVDWSKKKVINKGSGREASKIIEKDGWYYLIFSEHRNGIGRYVMAKRTRDLATGFPEEKQVAHASVEANEPNQGGIVLGPDNERWFFLTHHGSGDWSGRIVSLLPVEWLDGWPIPGTVGDDGIGTMAWRGRMPISSEAARPHLQRSDDFDAPSLGSQWQWNYQPRADYFSLDERPGWLRLKAFRPIDDDNLMKAGNTLTTRTFRAKRNEATVKLDISGMAVGQKCGLCHFSAANSGLGVAKDRTGTTRIEYRNNADRQLGPEINNDYIWIKSEWGLDGLSQYSYSIDGDTFLPFGEPYQLQWGNYRGDRIGIYNFNNLTHEGIADIDYFHYTIDR